MGNKIKIFATGGTIDSDKVNSKTNRYIFAKTHLPKMLKQARNKTNIAIEVLMMKDSPSMDDKDREIIAKKCSSCIEDKIIISHGTDTMSVTAKYLGKRISNKTIVFVGAMIPYNQPNSDALFNLGTAIANVQLLPKGVFVSMNGKIFDWNNVKKNRKLDIFETLKK